MAGQNDSSAGTDGQSGKQQTSSKRFVFTNWNSPQDREMCMHAYIEPPERVPSLGRTGLSTAAWQQVDRTDSAILICNRLHDGECAWPYEVGNA